jgi:hypothetical protein
MNTFEDTGDSGKPVHRNFCPYCGSPITSVVDAMPGLTFIKAGILDDPSWLKPTMEVYCDSVQPWITHAVTCRNCENAGLSLQFNAAFIAVAFLYSAHGEHAQ